MSYQSRKSPLIPPVVKRSRDRLFFKGRNYGREYLSCLFTLGCYPEKVLPDSKMLITNDTIDRYRGAHSLKFTRNQFLAFGAIYFLYRQPFSHSAFLSGGLLFSAAAFCTSFCNHLTSPIYGFSNAEYSLSKVTIAVSRSPGAVTIRIIIAFSSYAAGRAAQRFIGITPGAIKRLVRYCISKLFFAIDTTQYFFYEAH
jgi:hypothetical protein